MKKLFVFVLLGGFVLPSASWAIDLKQAKFTQVVNSVDVISQSSQARHAAAVNDVFTMPDVLRTGPDSRAELVAADNTITRVGANTVFSYDPASRTIDLQQGSLLFHSPHGKGGGTIHTGSATASVLGTTIIVTCTPNGGFKLLNLEGQAEIKFLNGLHQTLQPGQMTFALQGGGTSPVIVFRLDSQTKGSTLVNGFATPLPSAGKINAEVTRQLLQILNNNVQDTGLVVGNNATPDSVQVNINNQNQPTPFDSDASIIGSDKTVNQTLPVNYSPLDTAHVETGSFTPPSDPSGSFADGLTLFGVGTPASGFVGNNIDIDTGTRVPADYIDLSAFAGNPDFEFMAPGKMRIWQSLSFIGARPVSIGPDPTEPGTIGLLAGGQMLIAQNSTLEADTGILGLAAGSFGVLAIATDSSAGTTAGTADSRYPNTLLNVSIYNYGGDVDLLSESDLTIEGMNSGYTVYAQGDVDIQSEGSLSLGVNNTVSLLDGGHNVAIWAGGSAVLSAATDFNAYDAEVYAYGGGVDINAVNEVNIENASYIYAGNGDINVIAGGGIYISGGDLEAHSSVNISSVAMSGGNVNIYGTEYVDIYESYISGAGDVNISSAAGIALAAVGSSAGGDLDMAYSSIYAGGSIYAQADGNAYAYDLYADAYGGSIEISALGSVDITSGYSGTTLYADNGDVDIASHGYGNVTVNTAQIYASRDVNINSDGSVSVASLDTYSGSGEVDVESSQIYAGYDHIIDSLASATGGNVNINAYNGNVYLSGDKIYAYSGESTESGYVNIYGSGTVDVEVTSISADSDVDIESGGTLTLNAEGSDTIEAGGSVYLTSDYADVNIYNYHIYGDYGVVDISGEGSVYLSGDNIEAGYDAHTAYDVNINSHDSTIDIEDTYISATGDVNIESWGALTLGYESSSEIDANGSIKLKSDTGDVYVDYDLYADGNVNITSGSTIAPSVVGSGVGGKIDVEGSDIEAGWNYGYSASGGNVNINAYNGNVMLSHDYVFAYGGDSTTAGNINIYASGNVDFTHSDVYQDKSVTVTANSGYVNILDVYNDDHDYNISDTYLTHWTIKAGSDVDITGDRDVSIYTSTITAGANYGNVNISGGTYDYSSIWTSGGDVSISAVGEAYIFDSTIDLQGNITISGAGITYDAGGVTISTGGEADVSGDTVYIIGSSITGNNISISGSTVTANNGDVNIDNHGRASLYAGSYSDISGSTISLNNIDVSASTVVANGGNVNIISDGAQSIQLGGEPYVSGSSIAVGDILINDSSSIYASGDVNITSGGMVSRVSISSASDVGNIDIEGSDVFAGYDYNNEQPSLSGGSVNIHAYDGNVYLYNDDIEANIGGSTVSGSGNGNVIISGQTISATDGEDEVISANGGSIYISALNNVNIFNTTFDVGGGISISGSQISALDGNVDITSGGTLSIYAGGTVSISGSDVFAGNIDISGSTISANNGNVNIDNNGSISFASGFDSAGTILVEDSTIAANIGNVNIGSIGGVDLESSTVTARGSGGGKGNVTVDAGAGITVNGSILNADKDAGTIALNSTAGQTTISGGSSLQAFYISVNSPDGILLDGTSGGSLSGNTLTMKTTASNPSATDRITVKGSSSSPVNFGSFAGLNISAHTVDLSYVAFNGIGNNLQSFYGALAANPDTGAASSAGYVNFINGVTYAGNLVTSGNQSTYVNNGASSIHISRQ